MDIKEAVKLAIAKQIAEALFLRVSLVSDGRVSLCRATGSEVLQTFTGIDALYTYLSEQVPIEYLQDLLLKITEVTEDCNTQLRGRILSSI